MSVELGKRGAHLSAATAVCGQPVLIRKAINGQVVQEYPATFSHAARGGYLRCREDEYGTFCDYAPREVFAREEMTEPTPAPQSGYTACACRDCMDVTVDWQGEPALCSLCWEAECTPYEHPVYPGMTYECQRDDAYDA